MKPHNRAFVKMAFHSNPWEDQKITGPMLDEVLTWFIKCCETFEDCELLYKYGYAYYRLFFDNEAHVLFPFHRVMFPYLCRNDCETALGGTEDGTALLRIGSNTPGGIVLSTLINKKIVHVTLDNYCHQLLLDTINVPQVLKFRCQDGTILPKVNLEGLFRAEYGNAVKISGHNQIAAQGIAC